MRSSHLLFFLLLLSFACSRKDIVNNSDIEGSYDKSTVYGKVEGLPGRKVFLYELYGDQVNLIDSALATGDGSFEFYFPHGRSKGLYRLVTGTSGPHLTDRESKQLDLIWDGNTIVFETSYSAPADSMKIILSDENTLYFQFLSRMNDFDRKIAVLSSAIINYPETGAFIRKLEREYRRVQNRRTNYIDNLAKKNSGTIFSSIAMFYRLPMLKSPGKDEDMDQLKKNFFRENQFSDPVLLHTDLIPRKILRYLALYTSNEFDEAGQQYELVQAADVILQHAKANQEVYNFIYDYLINGFTSMEMDIVADHLRSHSNIPEAQLP